MKFRRHSADASIPWGSSYGDSTRKFDHRWENNLVCVGDPWGAGASPRTCWICSGQYTPEWYSVLRKTFVGAQLMATSAWIFAYFGFMCIPRRFLYSETSIYWLYFTPRDVPSIYSSIRILLALQFNCLQFFGPKLGGNPWYGTIKTPSATWWHPTVPCSLIRITNLRRSTHSASLMKAGQPTSLPVLLHEPFWIYKRIPKVELTMQLGLAAFISAECSGSRVPFASVPISFTVDLLISDAFFCARIDALEAWWRDREMGHSDVK